jgi:hypothetical protein
MNARLAPSQPTLYDLRCSLAFSVLLLAAVMDLIDVSIASGRGVCRPRDQHR